VEKRTKNVLPAELPLFEAGQAGSEKVRDNAWGLRPLRAIPYSGSPICFLPLSMFFFYRRENFYVKTQRESALWAL